jgi:phosphate/sulfate permease
VRWGIAGQVVGAWVLTIPGAFTIGWVVENIVRAVS